MLQSHPLAWIYILLAVHHSWCIQFSLLCLHTAAIMQPASALWTICLHWGKLCKQTLPDRNLPYRRQSKHRPEASSSGHTEETEERGVEVIGEKKCEKSRWTQSAVLHMYSISSQGLFLHYITAVTQSPALQWRLLFLTVWGNLGITGTIPLWFSFSAGKFTLLPFNYRRINSKQNHES